MPAQLKNQYVANSLRGDIRSGRYAPGAKLPTESELADHFKVSAVTIRSALAQLRSEGLIESMQGRGTFVQSRKLRSRYSRARYGRARSDRQLLSSDLEHRIVEAGRQVVPDHIAVAMEISPDTEVIARHRLLSDPVTGQIEEIGASYLPLGIAAGTYLEDPVVVPKALFLCVEELAGKTYTSARDVWRAGPPTVEQAVALGLPSGAAVVHLIHVARAQDGTILEVSESAWSATHVQIIDEYDIPEEAELPPQHSDI
ncbi:GntR family transcriptional regulator [Kribbella sp. NPDC059898]|uniref:GntR family transcriptional regulator n=1 Tax=Kribbella sp. NPDC059898 TaxID=3346995 RepID=UPI0036534CE5